VSTTPRQESGRRWGSQTSLGSRRDSSIGLLVSDGEPKEIEVKKGQKRSSIIFSYTYLQPPQLCEPSHQIIHVGGEDILKIQAKLFNILGGVNVIEWGCGDDACPLQTQLPEFSTIPDAVEAEHFVF
jgi:hypothetical protein